MTRSSVWIDSLGEGDLTLSLFRNGKDHITTGIPKRQARALANRIIHELDFAEGRRQRRPSSPHLYWNELQPCLSCGQKNTDRNNCQGRAEMLAKHGCGIEGNVDVGD